MTLSTERLLDEVGWQLLAALQQDARTPLSELARRVGLSAPAVAERVRRLEDAGIIRGYRAELDLARLGLPLSAWIRLTIDGQRDEPFLKHAAQAPEIHSCDRVTGTDCFVLRVVVSDVAHLERTISALKAYGSPITSLVLSSPVTRRDVEGPR
ncbi:Lrp/AsnC family transcriptional regulator [Deinococcus pimensis]|uniref:Lrp/AsnC family transcriptional regulator n=1 Tax=Deinococcus pimensis TaxID=309888 RepID=UPI000484EA9C|nr:Lrp/AsnC family transcriptional regulator [Deinococcus pimensis]